MSWFKFWAEIGWERLADAGVIEDAAEAGFDVALSMCGNNGQISIIEQTEPYFHEAAEAAAQDKPAIVPLVLGCPYPNAVSEILREAADVIESIIADGQDEFMVDDGDEEDFDEFGSSLW